MPKLVRQMEDLEDKRQAEKEKAKGRRVAVEIVAEMAKDDTAAPVDLAAAVLRRAERERNVDVRLALRDEAARLDPFVGLA